MFNPNQELSLADLARGVEAVHTSIGRLPGAQRIDPAFRAAQAGMLPADVIEQYNNARRFGTTARGEPLRAHMADQLTHKKIGPQEELPNRFSLYLRPESMGELDSNSQYMYYNPGLHFAGIDDVSRLPNTYPMSSGMMKRLERDTPRGMPKPKAYEINAMGTMPDTAAPGEEMWWARVPNKGQDLYALGYDVLRAAGQGNVSTGLTDVNKVRRLYNVGANRMGHGNFGGIAPLEESRGQLFNHPIDDLLAEREYLERLFGMQSSGPMKFKRGADLYDEAMGLTEKKLGSRYGSVSEQESDDELAGLLWMREAQMAGAYGPPNSAGMQGGLRLGDYRPEDTAELRNLVGPFQDQLRASGNRYRPDNAISANALGRQLTTEATVKRMLRGDTPEEIAADIIGRSPETAFTGRYRKGGLVAAAV